MLVGRKKQGVNAKESKQSERRRATSYVRRMKTTMLSEGIQQGKVAYSGGSTREAILVLVLNQPAIE